MIKKLAAKRTEQLIDIDDIHEEIRPIDDTDGYYASENGNIYHEYEPNKFYKMKLYCNHRNGYMYVRMVSNDNHNTYRVHRQIALCFIPNPNNYPVVGHKNNIKTDNRACNLYWTTWKENTQKAVDDGLLVNDKGATDSQSIQIACFDINKNFICFYGSAGEAHRDLNVSKSTIFRQSNHEITSSSRCGYYFRYKTEYLSEGFVL